MAKNKTPNWKEKIAGVSRSENGYAGRGPSRFTDERNAWGFTPNHEDAEYLGFYARMKREKFLALAAPLPDWKKNQSVTTHMGEGGKIATPMLYLKIPEGWLKGDFSQPAEVVGHEGRNRVTALPPHTVENVIIIPKYLRARNITPRMIEEIDHRLYTESDERGLPKRLEYDNLVRDADRAENPRPKNAVFVVPPFDDFGWGDPPEKVAQHTVEMTVATVDGVRVAYVSKDSPFNIALDRRTDPHYDGARTLRDTWTYYAVGKDGKPDNRLMTSPWGEAQRGAWQVKSLRNFHKSHSNVLPSRKIALELMAEMKAEWDAEEGGRAENPSVLEHAKRLEYDNLVKDTDRTPNVGGVQIPAYLRTPKLKPYIEQGLITQEIVDLYEKGIAAAERFAEKEFEIKKQYGKNCDFGVDFPYPSDFNSVFGCGDRLLHAIRDAKLDDERFPHFGNTGYRSFENLSSTFGQRLIQQARKRAAK